MARRVPWRRVCPDVVMNRIDEAIQARIYLLRETGPTGFLLKEDGSDRKFKVCFNNNLFPDSNIIASTFLALFVFEFSMIYASPSKTAELCFIQIPNTISYVTYV